MEMYWTGQSGFIIYEGERTVYIDPFKLDEGTDSELKKADYVLITHTHFDHLHEESLEKIVGPKTVVYCSYDARSKIAKLNPKEIVTMKPNEEQENELFSIRTYPAYNTNKEFHPKENEWLGFYLTFKDGRTIYHAGDTDDIEELHGLKADIVMLPVSGTYVMIADEAVGLAKKMEFDKAVPIHFGAVVGSVEDAKKFSEGVGEDSAIIPEMNKNLLEQ